MNSKNGQMTSTEKLQLAFAGLILIIFIGMLGFMLIEDYDPADALYMTIITLSTVGYGEVAPLHLSGKILHPHTGRPAAVESLRSGRACVFRRRPARILHAALHHQQTDWHLLGRAGSRAATAMDRTLLLMARRPSQTQ